MPLLNELGAAVRQRRTAMGMSQERLAALVNLSRASVNMLETGKLSDLSSRRIERVANELGFAVGLVGTRRPPGKSAVAAAARVASVPYAAELPAAELLESLRYGTVAPGYIPHLRALLQEAPVAILADVADELMEQHGIPQSDTWKRMRMLAGVLQCDRPLWLALPT